MSFSSKKSLLACYSVLCLHAVRVYFVCVFTYLLLVYCGLPGRSIPIHNHLRNDNYLILLSFNVFVFHKYTLSCPLFQSQERLHQLNELQRSVDDFRFALDELRIDAIECCAERKQHRELLVS